MNRQEAIKILKAAQTDKFPYDSGLLVEAMDMAISSLETEPCEDCISRKEAFEALNNVLGIWGRKALMELPSVYPKSEQEPKTGHWIGIDEEPHEVWECDHCGFEVDGSGCIDPYDYRDTYKFCPNCGAKMVEPQESEDKE